MRDSTTAISNSLEFQAILQTEPRLRIGVVGGKVISNGKKEFEKELDPFLSMAEGWGDLEVSRNT